MAIQKIIPILCVLIQVLPTQAQDFYEDGSMKLTEISTDKKYGREAEREHSIKVGYGNENAFLRALMGPNGEQIKFGTSKNCCMFECKKCVTEIKGYGFLTRYEITYPGIKNSIILYLNSNEYESPKCPVGLTFKKVNQIIKPVIYHADSIVRITYCADTVSYAPKNFGLSNKLGMQLQVVDTLPGFKGGDEALAMYFRAHPLKDSVVLDNTFYVYIAFVVNCYGNAGNYQLISMAYGQGLTICNKVLGIVNKMPQNWTPAMKNGEPVDCYQVLEFKVVDGTLDQVTYH